MSSHIPVLGAARKRKLDPTTTTIEQPRSCSKPVLESQLDLLNQGRFSDVTFIVGEMKERIPCHQLFLKNRSPVFEVMFSERWNQDIHKEIPLEDVQPKAFKMFLKFIYADNFAANVPESLELLQLAHMYQVQLLVDKCEKLLESQVTVKDAVAVFQAARRYDNIQLMDKVGDLMAKSLPKMQALPSFAQLDKETLMYILKRNDLKIKEVDLFRLAVQWAKNQKGAAVEQSLKDILPLIRFPTMSVNEFTTAVAPTEILPPFTVIELITYFGSDDEAKKSLASTLGFSIEKRQPEDAVVSVSLYPGDIANTSSMSTSELFQKLHDCLKFCNHTISQRYLSLGCANPSFSIGNSARSIKQPIQGIGLRGFSFYCPVEPNVIASPGTASRSFKKFTVLLKSKDFCNNLVDFNDNRDYKELLNLSSVQAEEGKITDIKFDTVIPLKQETIYCIKIEEISTTQMFGVSQTYHYKNFGPDPNNTVTVNIDNRHSATFAVRRNLFSEFRYSLAGPQLIWKLGFEEL